MYRIGRIKIIGLASDYKGNKSTVEEQVLVTRMGKVHVYRNVFEIDCRYLPSSIFVNIEETLSIGSIKGIEEFCTFIELRPGRISKERLIEVYNQVNLPEYAISMA